MFLVVIEKFQSFNVLVYMCYCVEVCFYFKYDNSVIIYRLGIIKAIAKHWKCSAFEVKLKRPTL